MATQRIYASSDGSTQQIRYAFGSRSQRSDSSFPSKLAGIAQSGRATYEVLPDMETNSNVLNGF